MTIDDLPFYYKNEVVDEGENLDYELFSVTENCITTITKTISPPEWPYIEFKITQYNPKNILEYFDLFPEVIGNSTKEEFDNLKFEMLNWLDKTFEK